MTDTPKNAPPAAGETAPVETNTPAPAAPPVADEDKKAVGPDVAKA